MDILYFISVNKAHEKAKSDIVFVHLSILHSSFAN